MTLNLRVAVYPHKPLFYGNDLVQCEGILCDLIKYLSKSMNFTTHYIRSYDRGRFEASNNSWSGAVGLLQRNVNLTMLRFFAITLFFF